MADLLEKEALEAWDERKRKARVLGEAAATKLLVPMVMMLAGGDGNHYDTGISYPSMDE